MFIPGPEKYMESVIKAADASGFQKSAPFGIFLSTGQPDYENHDFILRLANSTGNLKFQQPKVLPIY